MLRYSLLASTSNLNVTFEIDLGTMPLLNLLWLDFFIYFFYPPFFWLHPLLKQKKVFNTVACPSEEKDKLNCQRCVFCPHVARLYGDSSEADNEKFNGKYN